MTKSAKPTDSTKSTDKETNEDEIKKRPWDPHELQYQPEWGYHKQYPLSVSKSNGDLPITLNKKYQNKILPKDSYVVICKYPKCIKTAFQFKNRRNWYNFNKNHHRIVHGWLPYRVQIVSRLSYLKYANTKEFVLVNQKPIIDISRNSFYYVYKVPSGPVSAFIRKRSISFNIFKFLEYQSSKQILEKETLREFVEWAFESKIVNKASKNFKIIKSIKSKNKSRNKSQTKPQTKKKRNTQNFIEIDDDGDITIDTQSIINIDDNGDAESDIDFDFDALLSPTPEPPPLPSEDIAASQSDDALGSSQDLVILS